MHDLRLLRDDPAGFDQAMARRGFDPVADELLALDERKRALLTELQQAQSKRNDASKEIGAAKAQGDEDKAQAMIAEVAELKGRISTLEDEERTVSAELDTRLSGLPNRLDDDVPDGADESDNVVIEEHGQIPEFDFEPREHDEVGQPLGLDFETAALISGSRFEIMKAGIARLHRALGQFMLDVQVGEHGFTEVSPPLLVRDEAAFGTSQLPKFAEDLFRTTDDRWLISTAEISVTNMVRERIIDVDQLPMRLAALTPCFRSEAGAAGRDTKGMIRQHQFYKVEMVAITTPETSEDEHDRMTHCAETILDRLDLAYRRILLCSGDTGFGSAKTFDLEVWLPAQNSYREISSISNCRDFQARRMNARFRPEGEKATRFLHTLNGSGLAVGRTLVAILENYQEADGSVVIPEPLRSYMGGVARLEP